MFHDFSRTRPLATEGLSREDARRVQDEYAVLLHPCLKANGEKSGGGRYPIGWMILNDGRVTDVHVSPADPEGALVTCLRAQFARWRYPKYSGEWQHVEQEFRVSSTEQRRR